MRIKKKINANEKQNQKPKTRRIRINMKDALREYQTDESTSTKKRSISKQQVLVY